MTDRELLHEYLEYTSDSAFAELVRRHIDLVYWTCRRDTGDSRLADMATQDVFSLLAHKAGSIHDDGSVVDWLFERSRVMSRNILIREMRDTRLPKSTLDTGNPWTSIEPHLNDAVAGLSEIDREAILLRCCERRNLYDVGEEIGVSEEVTRSRVVKSIEALQANLEKKNVVPPDGTLESLLTKHAAPPCAMSAEAVAETALGTKPVATVEPTPASTADAPPKPRRRSAAPLIAAVTTIVVVVGIGAWLILAQPSTAPTPKLTPPPVGPEIATPTAPVDNDAGGSTGVPAAGNDPFASQPATAADQGTPDATAPAPTTPSNSASKPATVDNAPDVPTTPDGLIPGPTTPATSPTPPRPTTNTAPAPTERVLGVVTGTQPNAVMVIDGRERIVAPGDTIDSGRILAIAPDHVTVMSPDGRTINLPVMSTGR